MKGVVTQLPKNALHLSKLHLCSVVQYSFSGEEEASYVPGLISRFDLRSPVGDSNFSAT
jgi:hypothetical protein